MGSWADMDANYPPGKLTPATALVVALGHLIGANSVYAAGSLAAFVPVDQLGAAPELLQRAELYLREVPIETFLQEASELLRPYQQLCIILHLYDRLLATGVPHPEQHPFVARVLLAFAITRDQLQPHLSTLRIMHDFSAFPQ